MVMASIDERTGCVKLYSNKQEREVVEQYADLFAILKTTEKLERAWTRDLITAKEYEPLCAKLIAQFKTLWSTLRDSVPDVGEFMRQHSMQCPMALQRLVVVGLPATVEHGAGRSTPSSSAAVVAEITAAFITCLDSVRLNMLAVDQVLPSLSDCISAMNKMADLPADFSAKRRLLDWISKLNQQSAAYELDAGEARQLEHDLTSSYTEWQQTLK